MTISLTVAAQNLRAKIRGTPIILELDELNAASAAATASAAAALASQTAAGLSEAAADADASAADADASAASASAAAAAASVASIDNATIIRSTGTVAFAANQPMGTNKLTGLAAGSAAGDSVRFEQLIPPTVQTFAGSGTWTKPAGLKVAIIECVGGGGGGGYGDSAAGEAAGGSGGGGGGYVSKLVVTASLGATETVTIGAAGAGGVSAGAVAPTAGGTTSFGAHCTATGGAAGNSSTSGVGAALAASGVIGGIGTTGDINARGGSSLHAFRFNGTLLISGKGGDSIWGGGGVSVVDAVGSAGNGFGGGGGGASSSNNTDRNGGAGTIGYLIVTEYY